METCSKSGSFSVQADVPQQAGRGRESKIVVFPGLENSILLQV